jgi:hypothetical protein
MMCKALTNNKPHSYYSYIMHYVHIINVQRNYYVSVDKSMEKVHNISIMICTMMPALYMYKLLRLHKFALVSTKVVITFYILSIYFTFSHGEKLSAIVQSIMCNDLLTVPK